MRRSVLLGIVSLYGKVRYTLENYDHLVAMMQDQKDGTILPCASTMRKYVFPRILKELFMKSSIESFPMKAVVSTYVRSTSNLSLRQSEAVVVLPSSWAKLDVRCLHVLREIVCIQSCRCGRPLGSHDLRVGSTNHVTRRKQVSRHNNSLWVNSNGLPFASEPGMTIRMHTVNGETVSNLKSSLSGFNPKDVRYRGQTCTSFEVEIVSTVNVEYSMEAGVHLKSGIKSGILGDQCQNMYDSCVSFLETISRRDHESTQVESTADNSHNYNVGPRTRRQRHRQNIRTDNRIDDEKPYLIPSDHVT